MMTSSRSSSRCMMRRIASRVAPIRASTGVPAIGKKRIRCSGGGSGVTSLMRRSSVRLVRSPCAYAPSLAGGSRRHGVVSFLSESSRQPKKTAGGCPAVLDSVCADLSSAIASPSAERCENAKYAKNQLREIMAANVARRFAPRSAQKETESWIEGKCCPSARRRAVAALAGCATRAASAAGAAAPSRSSPSRSRCCRSSARARCFRCDASTASAATTRRTRARWAPTRRASRRSSSKSRATRSSTSRVGTTADHPYPPLTKNYHYEIELVAALGKGGRNVPVEQALALVYGYTIGLDMTRRDLQRAMGDEKKPWEIGKSFDHSAPMGPLHRVAEVGHFTQGRDHAEGQRRRQAERRPEP